MYPTPAPTPDIDKALREEVKLTLVPQLNALLHALQLPLELELPTELTPSLLIAILESLLQAHISVPDIPLKPSDPQENTPAALKYTQDVNRIKVFLGVLQTDVLQEDVGLSGVDPCRLAEGAWEESVFVGELLCWIGRRVGSYEVEQLKPPTSSVEKSNHWRTSPSRYNFTNEKGYINLPGDGPFVPRCIHEVPSPSEMLSELDISTISLPLPQNSGHSHNDTSANFSVRYEGYIEPVDEDLELSFFEASRSMRQEEVQSPARDMQQKKGSRQPGNGACCRPSRSNSGSSSHARTVELLFQRAQLLEELSRLSEV